MAKYVTVVCDNCQKSFIMDCFWTREFIMDTGADICPNCRILRGEDVQKDKEGHII